MQSSDSNTQTRWPTVIFGALPATFLAFPAALGIRFGVGLFQKLGKDHTELRVTQLVLAVILLLSSIPLAWMIMIVVSGALVG